MADGQDADGGVNDEAAAPAGGASGATGGDPLRELVRLTEALPRDAAPGTAGGRAWCGGAVLLAGHRDRTLVRHAAGWAARWAAHDRELPLADRAPVTPETLFDLASVTKLFTAIATVQQLERGRIGVEDPVRDHLPEFGAAGKDAVTVRHLLTHTSGLRPELPFHEGGWPERLWAEAPLDAPGTTRRYSDLNLLTLHLLLERVTGRPLDALLREEVTGPLAMADTRFGPVPAARVAATEDQWRPWAKADRGMLRGEVHDENAAALGGVAGHAGLFATADDLARLCRALLAGGGPVLRPDSVDLMLTAPGLGFAVDQPSFMGALAGAGAAGHTGFTGTSLVLDRRSGGFLVLLATTVHPVRPAPADSTPRAAAATLLARALDGSPRGPHAAGA
ncbi:serine hydrolase domain-containing protein [Streptomyces bohaiensis]|uniref:Beta-lactamase family protein n=1 Tax=Streptomyces bohaiensis TaxID=1431344 RepID=A0ABX1CDC8_9ACTN|nr:serine hydrolase domain-containing protein [Streptomyces bohaiensis]NJQ16113.1 beta-lactamase family protein [Streptomyces bohaiensis]